MVQILSKVNLLTKTPSLFNICGLRFKSTDFSFPVKNVEITTLSNFYKEQPNGLKFNVQYCDTKDYVGNQDSLTILCLHGSPGTHKDWEPYVEKLTKNLNVRIVAPSLPNFSATDKYPQYLHKVEEKAIYLNDFLKKVDIDKVDMLLTHSSGVYPSLFLWNNLRDMPDNRLKEIGSFSFFSPPGFRRIKAMRPKWFTQSCGDFYCTKFGRSLLRMTGPKIFKLAGVNMKLDNIDDLFIACVTMNNTREQLLEDHFKLINKMQLPVFYSFSEDDRLIEKEIFYECLDKLNLDKKDLVKYNKDTELSQLGDLSKINKAISFSKGGHYCFLKHHQIISNYLIDFIQENLIRRPATLENVASDLQVESAIEKEMLEKKQLKI